MDIKKNSDKKSSDQYPAIITSQKPTETIADDSLVF